jgi:cell division septation protein DedD
MAAVSGTAVLLALGLAGCSREADDWRSAQAADSGASYGEFLKKYPGSSHGQEAQMRLAQLEEDAAWQAATVTDSQMGYQQFLARYPEGKWAQEARVRIENFSLTPPTPIAAVPASPVEPPAPASAPTVATAPAPDKPKAVTKRPETVRKEVARPSAPASGFGVQLGAFTSKEKAEAAWSKLEQAHKNVWNGQSHQVLAGPADKGQLYRLRVPQKDEAAARKICERLKFAGDACVVYRP